MADRTRLNKLLTLLRNRRRQRRDATLLNHLEIIGAPELNGLLFWVEHKRLKNFRFHDRGGFAAVFQARVSWQWGCGPRPSANYALKELNLIELVLNLIMGDALLPIYGLTEHPMTGRYLMMMPLARGGTLESRRSNPIYSWENIAEQAKDLAEKLAKIHKMGFLHNDLHPGNVVYLWPHDPHLIDIALGSSIEEEGEPKGYYGRLEYLPPEIYIGGNKARVQASDVYCFATLIWQMVTGVPPRGDSPSAVRNNPDHLREELIPGMPDVLRNVLISCWNPAPAQRPTMESVHNDLHKWWCSIRSQGIKESYQNQNKTLFLPNTLWFIAQRQAAYQQEKDAKSSSRSFSFPSGSSASSGRFSRRASDITVYSPLSSQPLP
ncbi:kinase-like domain-containing protein [Endogone sp. FLAS-F59071]|nr:kinase-like domain-containing protein [Endogone sp. FLAS-F59071]|eukprot:RUS13590.1 kinase-like domain-containing protein [Endogone sp. FLAS-F59071]